MARHLSKRLEKEPTMEKQKDKDQKQPPAPPTTPDNNPPKDATNPPPSSEPKGDTPPKNTGPKLTGGLPTRCRIIEVTEEDGHTSPAIVNQVNPDGSINVMVFHSVMGAGNACISDVAGKQRQNSGEPNTWNWPPRA